jgi:hypothetical protein
MSSMTLSLPTPARATALRAVTRWLLAAIALLAALTAGSSAWARDDGDWQILQARYGTSSRNIDVTERLREVARSDRRVRVENELFGTDPAPREMKTLRLYARNRGGETRTFEFREGSIIDGDDFTGWDRGDWGRGGWNGGWDGDRRDDRRDERRDDGAYQILGARYGVPDANIDVTDRLKQLARRDLKVQITNDLFRDDPAPRRLKTLRIYARGRDGDVRTFEYREGSWIDGGQFTGWGRGDWGDRNWNGNWEGGIGGALRQGYNQGAGPSIDGRVNIIRASYGANGRSIDVTDRLRNISRGGAVDLRVSNDLFDRDPAEGSRKTLRVVFSIGRGEEQVAEAREGDRLRFP